LVLFSASNWLVKEKHIYVHKLLISQNCPGLLATAFHSMRKPEGWMKHLVCSLLYIVKRQFLGGVGKNPLLALD